MAVSTWHWQLVTSGLLAITAVRPSWAQDPAPPADGPIQCYVAATEIAGFGSRDAAMQLCFGAMSDAPARCADAADPLGLSDSDEAQLCQSATSTAPADCAARLEDSTGVSDSDIVTYCAASPWIYVVPQTPGVPVCVETALDRTDIPTSDSVQLCRGSTSTAPVDCFRAGDDKTDLSQSDLIDLCSQVVAWPAAVSSY